MEDNNRLKSKDLVDDGKLNLIRKVQILEKQVLEKDRYNKILSSRVRE